CSTAAQPQDGAKPTYTMPEYNAYQAAVNEKDARARVKLLDDFVAKYPASTLLVYIYPSYYTTYAELKDPKKVVEYCDKQLALGAEKVDINGRLSAAYVGTTNYYLIPKGADKDAQAKAAIDRARVGLECVAGLKKPENADQGQFDTQVKQLRSIFNYAVGFAAFEIKDYKTSIAGFKSALETNPTDGTAHYRIGLAYLQMSPPQHMDAFWSMAKSITLKGAGEAQVRSYLKNQIIRYQLQPLCENIVDQEMNELIALAGTAADRPANFNIPSGADIETARTSAGATFIADLKAGGDKAKLLWLALCHAEYPELYGKVFENISDAESTTLRVFVGFSNEELEAATAANSELKISSQPEAKRLEKDGLFRFAGTLASYDPEPYMLHWDKVKVNAEDIPEETAAATKATKATKGKAGKTPPKKRPPTR
ncbi:MAG: hypothetical protein HY046_06705, partial [Acidobacteria bacterium]|nr:hypothetical protein [Acidobacteriota bacterium]